MEELAVKYGLKIVGGLLLMLFLSGAAFGVYKHIELRGEHVMLERQKKADDIEHARRIGQLEITQKAFEKTVDALHQSETTNADLLRQSRERSHVNDSHSCLGAATAGRVWSVGAARRQADDGAVKPAGKAASLRERLMR
jgi:hypothetical protein